jgi:hypothetical protein
MKPRTWTLEDHLCIDCGGRILRCATGQGPTGGGNPVFMCADCGKGSRNQQIKGYRCLPFSAMEKEPGLKQLFLACGCNPDGHRAEVGIVLADRLFDIRGTTSH